jgi:transcriptional regulator with XRE-family HTH domain
MIKMKVGNRLLIAREERKINQADMAEILGVSPPTYSRLERNETSVDINQVIRFADILNIPIQDFLPDAITQHNTNNQNSQGGIGGMILGNIYNYYSEKEVHQENQLLKEKIRLFEVKEKIVESHTIPHELFFWQIVELSGEDYQKATEVLAQKSLSVIFEFEEFIAQKLYDLDRKSFAEKVYVNRPISKDDFLYVRCYTLAQGKNYYEKVLHGETSMLNLSFEPLLSLGEKAFFAKTACEFPTFRTSVSYETGSYQVYWL